MGRLPPFLTTQPPDEDAWDGSGHAPEVVRRESTGSKGIPAEMLGLKLKMKVGRGDPVWLFLLATTWVP